MLLIDPFIHSKIIILVMIKKFPTDRNNPTDKKNLI